MVTRKDFDRSSTSKPSIEMQDVNDSQIRDKEEEDGEVEVLEHVDAEEKFPEHVRNLGSTTEEIFYLRKK